MCSVKMAVSSSTTIDHNGVSVKDIYCFSISIDIYYLDLLLLIIPQKKSTVNVHIIIYTSV